MSRGLNLSHNYRNDVQPLSYVQHQTVQQGNHLPHDSNRVHHLPQRYLVNTSFDISYGDERQESVQSQYKSTNESGRRNRQLSHRDWTPTATQLERYTSKLEINARRLANRHPAALGLPPVLPPLQPALTLPDKTGLPADNPKTRQAKVGRRVDSIRTYSPTNSAYVQESARDINAVQRLVYANLRTSTNANTFKACGGRAIQADAKAFEVVKDNGNIAKPFTVNAETYGLSWIDPKNAKQYTSNYESAKDDIVNHGKRTDVGGLRALYARDKKVCHRVKTITQYAELTRISAERSNLIYRAAFGAHPDCFSKSTSLCAKACDYAKTNGPFFKLFK